jgi:hypothetical protein
MRNPPREEEHGKRACHVRGVERQRVAMHEVARVIQHHDGHDQPAEEIDRIDADLCRGVRDKAWVSCRDGVWPDGRDARLVERVGHGSQESYASGPILAKDSRIRIDGV